VFGHRFWSKVLNKSFIYVLAHQDSLRQSICLAIYCSGLAVVEVD